MRNSIFHFAAMASLAAVAAPLQAHDHAAKSTTTRALPVSARGAAATIDAFHAALKRGDTRAALALLADDALIFEEGGAERSKAEYASQHLDADAAFSQAVPSSVTSRTGYSDGTLAWIASEGRTTGSYKGKSLNRITTETMVLRRVAKAWKIVHIHWSSGAAS